MPKKADLLREQLDLIFADRQKQIELFRELITSVELEYSLLAIRGIGGIGKTMLLIAFQKMCVENNVPVALVDVGVQRSVAEVLRSIRDQLVQTQAGFSTESFDEAVDKYLEIDQGLRRLGIVSVRTLDFLSKAAVLAPSHSSPYAELGDLEEEDYGSVVNKIYQHLVKKDADYFLNPEEFLTRELLDSINEYARTSHLCIMFDRYEVVPVFLDRWIRRDFFTNLEKFAVVVISGRAFLPPEWNKWQPLAKQVELSPFPKSEVQELLELFGITSSYLVEQIAEFSGGVPLAVSLAAQLVKERETEDFMVSERYNVIEQLVEVLIRDASPELERVLETCAVLRWFSEESVAVLSEGELAPNVYKLVRGYDFVRRGHYGLEMHDRVRDFINQDLAQREPIRYRRLNQLASEYYEKLLNEGPIQDRRLLMLENLYHKLRADEKNGMIKLREVFNDAALLIQPVFCQALIEVAEGVCLQDVVHQVWIEYFKGSLARQSSDFAEAERIFSQLAQNPLIERDRDLKAELYFYWGVALWYTCKFPESLEISQEAVKLNHDLGKTRFENRALGVVGLVQDRLGDSALGIETVTRLVTQARKTGDRISEAYGLNSTGYFSWHTGKWDKAEEALLQCRQVWIDLGSEFGECYPVGHLGLLYTKIDDFERGLSLLRTCLDLSRDSGNREMESKTLQNLSEFERRNKRYKSAVEYAEAAYNLSHKLEHSYYQSDSLRLWGHALMAVGDVDEAIEKYTTGLSLAETLQAAYMIVRNQVALYRLVSEGYIERFEYQFGDIAKLAREKHYYHLLSELFIIEADRALNEGRIEESFDHYAEVCINALKYNWHWLDRTIVKIVAKCAELAREGNGEQALQLYDFLIQFWQEGNIDGTSLPDMENRAPRVRKGRGLIEDKVINRLTTEKAKLQKAKNDNETVMRGLDADKG